jgi:hypothetical protein
VAWLRLCTTTLPSWPAIFFSRLPSSFQTRRDFAREKLILSFVGTWRQRRTTSSKARGEGHGLRVTYHHPTEHACDFSLSIPSSSWTRRDFETMKVHRRLHGHSICLSRPYTDKCAFPMAYMDVGDVLYKQNYRKWTRNMSLSTISSKCLHTRLR